MTQLTLFVLWLLGFLVLLCWWHLRGDTCLYCGEDHGGKYFCPSVSEKRDDPPQDDEGDE